MCGIAGIIGLPKVDGDRPSVVAKMLTRLVHRGPDDSGMVELGSDAVLGHRRLAIIDVEHAKQPMVSADGRYHLTYNGEIYNYLELRQELIQRGVRFSTFSDTEVLLNLLILEGENSLPKLNGMFAFLFYDREEKQFLAARDPFGIKPFYYVRRPNEFVFGSEIKALLAHPEISAERSQEGLQDYLTFQFCLGSKTLFRDIHKLEPGTYITGDPSGVSEPKVYWEAAYEVDDYHNEDYFIDRLRGLLEESVRLQLRSDVPLGGYLSGGLDSSLVCSIGAEALGGRMPMFHGRFAEGPEYDESYYAKLVVESSRGEYFEAVPTAEDFVAEMPQLIYSLDEPLAGPGLFPQLMVSRLAREHVTVVLGGQGGDEIFGGYARYLVGYLEQALKGAIMETQEEGKHLVTLESIVPQLPLLKQYEPMLSYFWKEGLFGSMDQRYFRLIDRSQGVESILNPDLLNQLDRDQVFSEFQSIFNRPDSSSYINKMTHFDQKTLLPALLQVEDRVSMAVSLESRVPLLDTRIVELVTAMPPPLKFQGGRTKHILKKAIRNHLPSELIERKDKMGFPVPLAQWMKGGPVKDFVGDVLLSQRSLERGVFSREALNGMLEKQGVGGRKLWGALSLELWHQQLIDGDALAA